MENIRNNAQSTEGTTVTDEEQVENTSGKQTEIVEEQPNLSQYSLARDRQRRVIVPPTRYVETNHMNLVLNAIVAFNDHEPSFFEEAVNSSDARSWIEAMNEEINSLNVNDTWTLASLPKGCKPIAFKWIYKLKEEIKKYSQLRYKTRLVAKSFT